MLIWQRLRELFCRHDDYPVGMGIVICRKCGRRALWVLVANSPVIMDDDAGTIPYEVAYVGRQHPTKEARAYGALLDGEAREIHEASLGDEAPTPDIEAWCDGKNHSAEDEAGDVVYVELCPACLKRVEQAGYDRAMQEIFETAKARGE